MHFTLHQVQIIHTGRYQPIKKCTEHIMSLLSYDSDAPADSSAGGPPDLLIVFCPADEYYSTAAANENPEVNCRNLCQQKPFFCDSVQNNCKQIVHSDN